MEFGERRYQVGWGGLNECGKWSCESGGMRFGRVEQW